MFNVTYGNGITKEYLNKIKGKVVVVTQANLYEKYRDVLPENARFIMVETMEETVINNIVDSLDEFDVCVGFGGGMALDLAKYVSWKKSKDCILFPTAISVDACFSYPVAIRRDNKVNYVGKCIAKDIVVDYAIIRSAPKFLNISGVGDVLSCYTALFDWSVMCGKGKAEMVPVLYKGASKIIEDLMANAKEIADITDKGIKFVMDSYKWVGENGFFYGFCFYEEGSEHYLAYTIESINGLHLAHGQLVAMCVYIMSKFQQEGREKRVLEFLNEVGLSIKPDDVGVKTEDIRKALLCVNNYVVQEGLAYSLLNEKVVSEEFADIVIRELKAL